MAEQKNAIIQAVDFISTLPQDQKERASPLLFPESGYGLLQDFAMVVDSRSEELGRRALLDDFESTRSVITLLTPEASYPSMRALLKMRHADDDFFHENVLSFLDRVGRAYAAEGRITPRYDA